MKVRKIKQILSKAGATHKRDGRHEVWELNGKTFPISGNDGDEMPLGTMRSLFKLAEVKFEPKMKKKMK